MTAHERLLRFGSTSHFTLADCAGTFIREILPGLAGDDRDAAWTALEVLFGFGLEPPEPAVEIEQPGQASEPDAKGTASADDGVGTPAPVTDERAGLASDGVARPTSDKWSPEAIARRSASQRERRDREAAADPMPLRAKSLKGASLQANRAKAIAAGPYPCGECGREFKAPNGLALHRKHMHLAGVAQPEERGAASAEAAGSRPASRSTPWVPTPVVGIPPPVTIHARESWHCGRCPWVGPTKATLETHYESTGHDKPEPLTGRPVGRADKAGGGGRR